MPPTAAYHRSRRQRLKDEGLCVWCLQPNDQDGWLCLHCRREHADRQAKRYERCRVKKKRRKPRQDERGISLTELLARIVHNEKPLVRRAAKELFAHLIQWLSESGLTPSDAIKVNWVTADMIHEKLMDDRRKRNGDAPCTATSAAEEKTTTPNSRPLSTSASAA